MMPTFLLLIHPSLRIVLAEEGEASGVILTSVQAPSWIEAKIELGFDVTERDVHWIEQGTGIPDEDLW
jgi:hypothetical protein